MHNLGIASAMERAEIREIQSEEPIHLRLSRRHQVQIVKNGASARPAIQPLASHEASPSA
jgi:hypothetical protein